MKTIAGFARLIEREIEIFVEIKVVVKTKTSAKVAMQVFQKYLKEKKLTEPEPHPW